MQANPGIFLKRVSNYSFLEEEQKEKLLLYFKDRFFTEVIFHETIEDFDILEKILEELNYECDKIKSFFSAANAIRRVKNPNIRPSCQYVEVLLRIFKEFNLDCDKYNVNNMPACNVLDYAVKRILDGKEKLNGEISIFELTNQIYNKYYFGKDKNEAVVKILKILDSVEKGVVNRKDSIFLNKKIMELFECSQDISDLSLRKVVETYYPYFKNELFSIIRKATELEEIRPLDSYKLARYLDDLKEIWDKADSRTRRAISDILKVDLSAKENVNQVFSDLMDSVRGNKIIDETMKESILIQIKEIYERYQKSELIDVENELKIFFRNYSYFVYDLIIPTWSKQDDFRELISSCLRNCKDFFVKCDGEKFKEIVEYLINFTNLEAADLVEASRKCVDIFKDSCREKMRIINESLSDFAKSLDVDNAAMFEDIFVKNPQLLLNDENNLISIVEFLKGNISLKDYGCSWNFKLPQRFLSKSFYRKLENNDFKDLFDITLNDIVDNLTFLEGICSTLGISFSDLMINEDMIYVLLNRNLSDNYSVMKLKSFFSNGDLKKLIELNPSILTINDKQLSLLVEKSIKNENEDYNFLDLLSSELYFFSHADFVGKTDKQILNYDFRYVELSLAKDFEYDILDIATSDIIANDINDLLELYENKNTLYSYLDELNANMEFEEFYRKLMNVYELYLSLYQNVPCKTVKDKINNLINERIEKYLTDIETINENVAFEDVLMRVNSLKLGDEYDKIESISALFDLLNKEKTMSSITESPTKSRKDISKLKKKESQLREKVSEYMEEIRPLKRKIELLNDILQSIDKVKGRFVIEDEIIMKSAFSVSEINAVLLPEDDDELQKLLGKENVIIFSDGLDLEEIPNDRNFFEKLNKFLGKTDFSILSREFMQRHSTDSDFIEKYSDNRSEVWARRENRTPVRVYFMPIDNKYFPCYYVYSVNCKDHNHQDGDCPTEAVYKARIREKEVWEKRINELSVEGAIEFIKVSQKRYERTMSPIVKKIKKSTKK